MRELQLVRPIVFCLAILAVLSCTAYCTLSSEAHLDFDEYCDLLNYPH